MKIREKRWKKGKKGKKKGENKGEKEGKNNIDYSLSRRIYLSLFFRKKNMILSKNIRVNLRREVDKAFS